MKVKLCISVFITCLYLIFIPRTVHAQGTTLIDFGNSQGSTTFGLAGWTTILKSSNLDYSSLGNGGVIATVDAGEFGDYRGVSGTSRFFSIGERIVVTWYNNSDDNILRSCGPCARCKRRVEFL